VGAKRVGGALRRDYYYHADGKVVGAFVARTVATVSSEGEKQKTCNLRSKKGADFVCQKITD